MYDIDLELQETDMEMKILKFREHLSNKSIQSITLISFQSSDPRD